MRSTVYDPPLAVLETERLRIVPLDGEAFEAARRNPDETEELRAAMEELAERAGEDRPFRFAWYTNRLIYRREDSALIGSVACMNSPEKDPDHLGLVEVGYSIDPPYRGKGYMTEALSALCDWILSQRKVYGVIAGVLDGNPASDRVLEKCGFTMTDHSDTLGLGVWKRIPPNHRPMRLWERFF